MWVFMWVPAAVTVRTVSMSDNHDKPPNHVCATSGASRAVRLFVREPLAGPDRPWLPCGFFAEQKLRFPDRVHTGPNKGDLTWARLEQRRISRILHKQASDPVMLSDHRSGKKALTVLVRPLYHPLVRSGNNTTIAMDRALWSQSYLLFGQGLAGSALIAALPVFTLFMLLGILRKPAWIAGLSGLAITFVLAVGAYGMPAGMALGSAGYGAAFGLFPISWIVFWAIVLYRLTLETGKFEIIKDSIGSLTTDPRLQALLIAFGRRPFKGKMATSLSVYPETLNLKLEIIVQPVGTRPLLRLEEAGHPLAIEQRSASLVRELLNWRLYSCIKHGVSGLTI